MVESEESAAPSESVFVTLLSVREAGGAGAQIAAPKSFEASILSFAGRDLELLVPCAVDIYTALKIERPQAIWLGTVLSCHPEDTTDGEKWRLSISVSRVLDDFETLQHLSELFGSHPISRNRILRTAAIRI